MELEYIFEKEIVAKMAQKIVGTVKLGKQNENVFRILSVVVDEAYRGQGIAGKLVSFAATIARQNNFKLIPVCSFAVSFFERHKEYNDVLGGC